MRIWNQGNLNGEVVGVREWDIQPSRSSAIAHYRGEVFKQCLGNPRALIYLVHSSAFLLPTLSILPIGNVTPIRVKVHQVYSKVPVEQIPLVLHWGIVLVFLVGVYVVVGNRVVVQLHKVESNSIPYSRLSIFDSKLP